MTTMNKKKSKYWDRSDFKPINPRYINMLLSGKQEKKKFARLNEIPDDAKLELYNITKDFTISDDNEKAEKISAIMEPLGFVEIGCGTNRIAFRKHGYVFKVALDERGIIDNTSEYQSCIDFPQYFMKVYEALTIDEPCINSDGKLCKKSSTEVIVCEYCELVSEDYFIAHRNEVKAILGVLSNYYIMEDIGLTTKNFCNWGIRTLPNGEERMVLIDNAYFYPIKNAEMITCSCGGKIMPTEDFTGYRCTNSACAMHFSAAELLNMSKHNYDSEYSEAIKIISEDGTENYIKINGTSQMNVEIDKSEAEELLENYKPASSFDMSTVDIVTDVEKYWLENSDESDEEEEQVPQYTSINLAGGKQE